ncbi:response regulator [Azospirillum sp.]|uniref:response regulator n=1 Tax=Azospirillum sp. TaxID=34012 RepID=UPI002D46D162|nr:response regulator [Azospirillum sp.]HYD66689.1 response regulator [Azospirillum sp.]
MELEAGRQLLIRCNHAPLTVALGIKTVLLSQGHEVVGVAATAERALHLAEQHSADMALMDINIRSAMNGIETAARLKELYNMPIVFVTAQADSATRAKAMAINPVGYLTKPYTAAELTKVVADALSSLHS